MGDEEKRGIKDTMWGFRDCEEWRVPTKRSREVRGGVKELTMWQEGDEMDAEGRRCCPNSRASTSCQSGGVKC